MKCRQNFKNNFQYFLNPFLQNTYLFCSLDLVFKLFSLEKKRGLAPDTNFIQSSEGEELKLQMVLTLNLLLK